MYPRVHLKRSIGQGLFIALLAALLVISDLFVSYNLNSFHSNVETPPHSGTATITASNASALTNAWSYTLDGLLQSTNSPVVVDGVVYIGLVSKNSGSDTGRLDALDAKTGARLWSFATSPIQNEPIISDGMVFISSADYTNNITLLDALNAKTGVKLWSYTAQGSLANLVVAGDFVYLSDLNGLDELDAKTGAKLWSVASGAKLLSVAYGIVYSSVNNGNNAVILVALDAKTGAKLWSYTAQGDFADLAVASGIVYGISTAYINGTNAGTPDTLYALDVKTGAELWSYATGESLSLSAIANGVIYISSVKYTNTTSVGTVDALDAKTGAKFWSYTTEGSLIVSTVIYGMVYIGPGEQGVGLSVLDAASGKKVWGYDTGPGTSIDTSAIDKGIIYTVSQPYGKLSAINAKSGVRLWLDFIGVSLESSLAVSSKTIYVSSYKTLYAFAVPTGARAPARSPTTVPSSPGGTPQQHLFPSINNAPVFADVPGLHIQSTDGLQCPLGHSLFPPGDLVFAAGRLTYTQAEIQQIRDYLHTILYGAEPPANAHLIAPPPTLRWVAGSAACTLSLEVSNTGSVPLQVSALGVQLTADALPNSFQNLHTLDFCSVASQDDAVYVCGGPSAGGGCGEYNIDIDLQPALASAVFNGTIQAGYGGGGSCSGPTLQPNDTLVFAITLRSPGATANSVAPYIYSVVPLLTVTSAGGSQTYKLSAMTSIAAFTDEQHVTCFGLPNDQATTFVPINSSSYSVCLA